MSLRKVSLLISVLMTLSIVAPGCSMNISRELPDRKYYALEIQRDGPENTVAKGAVLKVVRVSMSPRYKGRELVYRTGELAWESDFYNQWFELPAHMLTGQVRDWFRDSALFEHVPDPVSHIEASHILESNVVSLYGDFRKSPEAVIEMQFFLIREDAGITDIVFNETYRKSIPIQKASAEALVAGFNSGLAEILSALEEDLKSRGLLSGVTPDD